MTPEYYREVRERIVSRLAELEATALAADPMDSDGFWGSSHGARSIVYLRCELVRLEREWREAAERAEASLVVTDPDSMNAARCQSPSTIGGEVRGADEDSEARTPCRVAHLGGPRATAARIAGGPALYTPGAPAPDYS